MSSRRWIVGLVIPTALLATVGVGAYWAVRDRVGPAGSAGKVAPANGVSESYSPVPKPLFFDATGEAGIEFVHDPGVRGELYIPETIGSGGAWLDYDNDGDLDLYLVQGGQIPGVSGLKPLPNRLYENLDGQRFQDVTESSGAADTGYGMGCCVGDIDNDGWVDLYVTNLGPNALYRNQGGDRFEDWTLRAGVGDDRWGTSCAFVDYDKDGWLDLVTINYLIWSVKRRVSCIGIMTDRDYCHPEVYDSTREVLYHNNRDGTFTDVTKTAGLVEMFGRGLGVICDDFDDDGWIDIYVANDATHNQMWINRGDGTFVNRATEMGCAVNAEGRSEASMGVAATDIDDDGDIDLICTHLDRETHTLYRNQENRYFEDDTLGAGLGDSLAYTGWGTAFFDYDHDGRVDLFVANGKLTIHRNAPSGKDPYSEPNTLYHQDPTGRFVDHSRMGGPLTQLREGSRGALFGDYDNDGDIDVVLNNNRGSARLIRNDAPLPGTHWVMVRALLANGRDAYGARVTLRQRHRTRIRTANPCYGFMSSNDPRVHFGLGPDPHVDEVAIRWPSGTTEKWTITEVDRLYLLRQGTGRPLETGNDDDEPKI